MSEWISVDSSEKPIEGDIVLVSDGTSIWVDEASSYWLEIASGKEYFGAKGWFSHWMPSPDLPE